MGQGLRHNFTFLLVDTASQIPSVTIHKFILFPLDLMESQNYIICFAEVTATYVVYEGFFLAPSPVFFSVSSC